MAKKPLLPQNPFAELKTPKEGLLPGDPTREVAHPQKEKKDASLEASSEAIATETPTVIPPPLPQESLANEQKTLNETFPEKEKSELLPEKEKESIQTAPYSTLSEGEEIWVVESPEITEHTADNLETSSKKKLVPPLTQTLFTELLDQRVSIALKTEAAKEPIKKQLNAIQEQITSLETHWKETQQSAEHRLIQRIEEKSKKSIESENRTEHLQFREAVYRADRRAYQRILMEMLLVTGGIVLISGILILWPYKFFPHLLWSKFLLLVPLLFTASGISVLETLNQKRQILEERIASRERTTGLPALSLSSSPTVLMFLRTTLWVLLILEILLLIFSRIT